MEFGVEGKQNEREREKEQGREGDARAKFIYKATIAEINI